VRNRQELENLVISMHAGGWKKRALARHFEISKNTVKKILKKNKAQRDHGHDVVSENMPVPRKSKLDSYIDSMNRLLEAYPDITGVRMYEQLVAEGFDGGKTIVTDRLRRMRPLPKKQPVVRFETEPGKQGQMDWSEYKIRFSRTGRQNVLCFSYILGFSRKHYVDFTPDRKFFTLIRRHQDAFEYFGGVPETGLYDGEKTVVLRWEAGQPLFNPAFISFITHYRCRPIACKPRRPETKGKVEEVFYFLERNLLNARTFEDMQHLRQTARWWMLNRSDTHIHGTTGRPPGELFLEKERRALVALPRHPYDASEVALRVCRVDGFVEHDTNVYSVPYEYVADILTLKATENEIFIYSPDLKQIACHERQPFGAGIEVQDPDHRKSAKVRYGLEPVKEAFLQLGRHAPAFLEGLKKRYPRNCGFQARHILGLKQHYHSDDINGALGHATRYYAFDGKSVERILKARFKPRALESVRNEQAAKLLSQLPRVRQRPLTAYGKLLSI
jgi:transposase